MTYNFFISAYPPLSDMLNDPAHPPQQPHRQHPHPHAQPLKGAGDSGEGDGNRPSDSKTRKKVSLLNTSENSFSGVGLRLIVLGRDVALQSHSFPQTRSGDV